MKKLSLKSIIQGILALCMVSLLVACSADDNKDNVVINNVTVDKTDAYIDEKVTLNIDGTGYTDSNLYVLNPSTPVRFTKIAPTTFEITSDKSSPRTLVFAELSNSTNKTENSLEVSFYIHGVDNFTYAEGIKPTDPSSKVQALLGEPTDKTISTTDPSVVSWAYTSKGISVTLKQNSAGALLVANISLLSSNFYYTKSDGTKVNFTNYAGDLGNGWKINNINTKMDAVIAKLGLPTQKASDPNNATSLLRTYTFSNNVRFTFYGATVDDYAGKVVQSCSL